MKKSKLMSKMAKSAQSQQKVKKTQRMKTKRETQKLAALGRKVTECETLPINFAVDPWTQMLVPVELIAKDVDLSKCGGVNRERMSFYVRKNELTEAGVAFREIVGWLDPLRDSLLGRCPKCCELISDGKMHRSIRKMKNGEELVAYGEYITELIAISQKGGCMYQPFFCGFKGNGFVYRTSSEKARIGLFRRADGTWMVHGQLLMLHPDEMVTLLRSKGVTVVQSTV